MKSKSGLSCRDYHEPDSSGSFSESSRNEKYSDFDEINGNHRFKEAAPDAYVEYATRTRKGGRVTYFNFALAQEMGLIAENHSEKLDSELESKLLQTFSLVIINEYDLIHKKKFPRSEVRPNRYMATRYLQLQHPGKTGKTSGDGRGIWNGEFRRRGKTWDISSSGTGATRLSPACALEKKFFQTGDRKVGYGNGYSSLDEGLSSALMSEIFHRNGIETERLLLVISFKSGSSINVRASQCLLRPSHFFCHLKQGNYSTLKAVIDFFIERQIENKEWPETLRKSSRSRRYSYFAQQMALIFSKMVAVFESQYIFCWLDWDGDNVLARGGIIDYGSVRQFGLYHHHYRYDDVARFSTSISEQKLKARKIVQAFAQIRDFLITGKKRRLSDFNHDSVMNIFEKNFSKVWNQSLLQKMGFKAAHRDYLLECHLEMVNSFRKHYRYFERIQSKRGIHKVADGISSDAVFSMKDLLRELPRRFSLTSDLIHADDFIKLSRSSYAKRKDLVLSINRKKQIDGFQKSYLLLVDQVAHRFFSENRKKVLLEMGMRSSLLNQKNRITGDGVLVITEFLMKIRKRLSFKQFCQLFRNLIANQTLIPLDSDKVPTAKKKVSARTQVGALTLENLRSIEEYSQSL